MSTGFDDDTTRFEYYWENGRVVEYTNIRHGRAGRWPNAPHSRDDLIVGITRSHSSNQINTGPQATPDRLAESLLRFSRYHCDPHSSDFGIELPPDLMAEVATQMQRRTEQVTRQWEATGGEVGQQGMFAGNINDLNKFQFGDWEVSIRVQVFSSETKEPEVGADMGIIVDLRRGSQQVVKAALVQAKREAGIPEDPMSLPRMEGQVQDMRQTTDECYGLIFSDQDTYFFSPNDPGVRIPVEQFFKDKLVCKRGDRNPNTVAQAYDRSIVIDVTVATGGAVT